MLLAIPNKGRLHYPPLSMLERAGLPLDAHASRKLYADTVDPAVSVLFARAADIPEYIHDGAAVAGITGRDNVAESGRELIELLDLGYGRCELVVAVPEDGAIDTPAQLEGATIATEFPAVTREYLASAGLDASIVEVSGATELTPHVEMADAIVDITSTGTTLRMNRLRPIDTVLESSVGLYAHPDHAADETLSQLVTALQSVRDAQGKRYLMMNVPGDRLEAVLDEIPGLGGPTVMDVADDGTKAVHAVVDDRDVFAVVEAVRSEGATGILVTQIERLLE